MYSASYMLTDESLFGLVKGKALFWVGRDSVVGITTRYGLYGTGIKSRCG